MPKTKTHPLPCANCGHTDLHGEVSGCIAVTSAQGATQTTWCDCDTYVSPRDRAKDQAEGVAAGTAGADAALHGHAMTYDSTEWRARAEARLDDLIAAGTEFTAEDVTDVVGQAPSPNAIGGLFKMKSFKSRVDLVRVDTATRPQAKGRMMRVWKAKAA